MRRHHSIKYSTPTELKEDFPINTGYVILYFFGITVMAALLALLSLCFQEMEPEKFHALWTISLKLLIVCTVILCGVAALKLLTWRIFEKIGVEKRERVKYEVLIGLGAIAICGFVPRILVFYYEPGDYLTYYGLVVYPTTCLIFYAFFAQDLYYAYKPKIEDDSFLLLIGMILSHVFLTVVGIRASFFYPKGERSDHILITQIWFTCLPETSSTEFALVLKDILGLRKKDLEVGNEGSCGVTAVESEDEEDDDIKIDCKICLQNYSDTLIPRVLTGCGHTVCQKCAENLLKKNYGRVLICPFCQEPTAMNGQPAQKLSKNHAISVFQKM